MEVVYLHLNNDNKNMIVIIVKKNSVLARFETKDVKFNLQCQQHVCVKHSSV